MTDDMFLPFAFPYPSGGGRLALFSILEIAV